MTSRSKSNKPNYIIVQELTIKSEPIGKIRPDSSSPRKHSKRARDALASAVATTGILMPIVVDEQNLILAGNLRYEVALLLGLNEIPVMRVRDLSEAQRLSFRLGDNRIVELGEWDKAQVYEDLVRIEELAPLSIRATGFSIEELELHIDVTDRAAAQAAETPVPPLEDKAVSRVGDVWRCGAHAICNGDATKWPTYAAVMGSTRAAMIISDVPFNVAINGHVSGKGSVHHREFVAASGEMDEAQFTRFLADSMANMARASIDGSLHYLFIDWRHLHEMLVAGRLAYDELINLIVWAKPGGGGMGSLYRSRHELILIFKKGRAGHKNRVALGKHGRNRSNVWEYAGMSSFSSTRKEELKLHPTVKPLALIADAILDVTTPGDIVLDPFGGSGTTMLAAEQTGRIARLMELDPLYVDVTLRRFQDKTGIVPVLDATRESFEAVAARRRQETKHVK